MSDVVYSFAVSLDGFVEGPKREIDWSAPDEELHAFYNERARDTGMFVHGRRIYELMASYWPAIDEKQSGPAHEIEFARIWTRMPKLVFSRSLDKVGWNSTLARDVDADEIRALKSRPGKDMDVGGPTLAVAFMRLGLIDEYRLFVFPIVLGGGTPYFPSSDQRTKLCLVELRKFGSGVVYLRYRNP
jgi:dihydrofolate reductase